MKKIFLVGVAILAVSTSAAFAKQKHMMKPAAAAAPAASGPTMMQPSAADKAMYMKNKHDSGMK